MKHKTKAMRLQNSSRGVDWTQHHVRADAIQPEPEPFNVIKVFKNSFELWVDGRYYDTYTNEDAAQDAIVKLISAKVKR